MANNDENHASLVGGWATPLKNDGVKVSWDDDIPNIMGKTKAMFCSKPPTSSSVHLLVTEVRWGKYSTWPQATPGVILNGLAYVDSVATKGYDRSCLVISHNHT